MAQPKVSTYKTALVLNDTLALLRDIASACDYLGKTNNRPLDVNGLFGVLSYAASAAFDKLADYEEKFTKACGLEFPLTVEGHKAKFDLLDEYRPQASLARIFDMRYSTPGHWLKKTITRHNQCHSEKLPMISFHGLRHTNATLLISQGVDPRTVSGRLGHRNVSTTLNI